jgi:hypothetical protein
MALAVHLRWSLTISAGLGTEGQKFFRGIQRRDIAFQAAAEP